MRRLFPLSALTLALAGCPDIDVRSIQQPPRPPQPSPSAKQTVTATPKPPAAPPTASARPAIEMPPPLLGHSDLGSGLPATQVYIGDMGSIAFAADGAPLLAASHANRIWRIEPDGRLTALAGAGHAPDDKPFQDVPALELGLGQVTRFQRDGKGGWLLGEVFAAHPGYRRLTRLDAQGRASRLWLGTDRGDHAVSAAWPAGDGFGFVTSGNQTKRWSLALDGTAKVELLYPDANGNDAGALAGCFDAGLDDAGVLRVTASRRDTMDVLRYDPAADKVTVEEFLPRDGWDTVAVDGSGNRFTYETKSMKLTVTPAAGGAKRVVFDQLPPGMPAVDPTNRYVWGAALAPDGSVYVAVETALYRIADGKATRVAGYRLQDGPPPGTPISAASVGSMTVLDDGKLLVTDGVAGKTYVRATVGGPFEHDPRYDGARKLRVGSQGKVVTWGRDGFRTQAAGGSWAPLLPNAGPFTSVEEFLVAQDGTVYFTELASNKGLQRVALDGTVSVVAPDTPRGAVGSLAQAPDGTIYGAATQSIWKLAGSTWEPAFGGGDHGNVSQLAVDAQGRVYATCGEDDRVVRWDPATGKREVVAGLGGKVYDGVGVDRSLDRPGAVAIDANGDLLIADGGHQQVKRVPRPD